MKNTWRIKTNSLSNEWAVADVTNPADITSDKLLESKSNCSGDETPASVAASRIKMTGAGFGSAGALDCSALASSVFVEAFPRSLDCVSKRSTKAPTARSSLSSLIFQSQSFRGQLDKLE